MPGDTLSLSSLRELIDTSIANLDSELRDINHKIHSHPELGYQEVQAHDNIVSLLRSQDISVTPHAHGLQTAFEASFGTGGRLVVFNVEYDALPGIGHACGHNLIATGSLAAFFAVVGILKANPSIAGRVRALGTPAEEGGGGKIRLIDAGAYKDVDACLMTHPMSGSMFPASKGVTGIAFGTCVASAKFRATFSGRTAHAAAAPQDGINALDAAVLAYNGISMLRQQILPTERIHGIILEGGEKPNVIPSRSVMDYNVRSPTIEQTKELQDRVVRCFEGAAHATGCEVEFQQTNNYAELTPNRALCSAYATFMAELDSPQLAFRNCNAGNTEDDPPCPGSYSTDQGNVTRVCPGFHPVYNLPSATGANHTKEFTAAAITDEAYKLTLDTAKGMAATAWKLLSDDSFAREVRSEFERSKAQR